MNKQQENALRKAVAETIPIYESEYDFYNSGGTFVERILNHSIPRGNLYLRSSIYIALSGCATKFDGLSILQRVRAEIEEKILSAYKANYEATT